MAVSGHQECRNIDYGLVNEILNGGLESREKCSMIANGILETMSQPMTIEIIPENERQTLYMRKHQADLNVLKGLREILELDEEIPSIRCIVSIFENPRLFSDIIDACDEAFPERFETGGIDVSQTNSSEYIAVSEDYLVNDQDELDIVSEDEYAVEDARDSHFEKCVSNIFPEASTNPPVRPDHSFDDIFSKKEELSSKCAFKDPIPDQSDSSFNNEITSEQELFTDALRESTSCSIKFGHMRVDVGKWKQTHDELDEECTVLTRISEVCDRNFKPIYSAPLTPSVFDLCNVNKYLRLTKVCDECLQNNLDVGRIFGCNEFEPCEAASRSYLKLTRMSKKRREDKTTGNNNSPVYSFSVNDEKSERSSMEGEIASSAQISGQSAVNDLSPDSDRGTSIQSPSPESMEESVDSGVFSAFVKNGLKPIKVAQQSSNIKNNLVIGKDSGTELVSDLPSENGVPKVSGEEEDLLVKRICQILDKMSVPSTGSDVKSKENNCNQSNSAGMQSDVDNLNIESKDLCMVSDMCPDAPVIGPCELGSCPASSVSSSPASLDSSLMEKERIIRIILESSYDFTRKPKGKAKKEIKLLEKRLGKRLKKWIKMGGSADLDSALKELRTVNGLNGLKNKKEKKLKSKKKFHSGLFQPNKEEISNRKVFIKDAESIDSVKNGFKESEGRRKPPRCVLETNSLKISCSNDANYDLPKNESEGVNFDNSVMKVQPSGSELPPKKSNLALYRKSSAVDSIPSLLSDTDFSKPSKHFDVFKGSRNSPSSERKVSKSLSILADSSEISVSSSDSRFRNVSMSAEETVERKETGKMSVSQGSSDSGSSEGTAVKKDWVNTPIRFKLVKKGKPKVVSCMNEAECTNTDKTKSESQLDKSSPPPVKSPINCSNSQNISKLPCDASENNPASPSTANLSDDRNPRTNDKIVTNGLGKKSAENPRNKKLLDQVENNSLLPTDKKSKAVNKPKLKSKKNLKDKDSKDSPEKKRESKGESSAEQAIYISDDDSDEEVSERRERFLSKGKLPKRLVNHQNRRLRSRSRSPVRRRRSRSNSPRFCRRDRHAARSPQRRYRSPNRHRSPSPRRRGSSRSRQYKKSRSPLFKLNSEHWPSKPSKPSSISVQLTEASRTVYETNYPQYPMAQHYSGCQTTNSYQLPLQYPQYYSPSPYQTAPAYTYPPPSWQN